MPACRACGTCCTAIVPVTMCDIARLANHLGEEPGAFFARALGPALSPTFGLPLLAKRPDGLCVLQDEAGRCLVHPVKPLPCGAFACLDCPADEPPDGETLTVFAWLTDSPAARRTRIYLEAHGLIYREKPFLLAAREDGAGNPR